MATILIVDDSPDDRELLATLLRHQGHETIEAEDGLVGLQLARSQGPDLVIGDILMPSMDGYEMAHHIRSDPALGEVPVILSTARATDPELLRLAEQCGVSRVLQKPWDVAAVLATTESLLRDTPSRRDPIPAEAFEIAHQRLLTDELYGKVQELEQANAQLRRSEAKVRTLLDFAPDAIVGVDRNGRIALVTTLTEKLFGYDREELLGQPVEILVPELSRAAHVGLRSDYLAEPMLRPMASDRDVQARRRDGTQFPVSVTLNVIEWEGSFMGLASVRDITDRVEAERERAQLQNRLQQSHRLQSLGELAGGVSHDFNNLLAVILNYASFVEADSDAGDQARQDVGKIRAAAEKAAALTRQLLLFSQMEPDAADMLHLDDVVRDLEEMLRRTIGEHIVMDVACDAGLHFVMADRSKLEQVVVNLVVNARDAMPGGGRVSIECANATEQDAARDGLDLPAGGYVALRVRDRGTGMDQATRERAFEPFFTTKPRGTGTGLGLATVFGVVSQAGGGVGLTSEPGAGTTVSVFLPVAGADREQATTGSQPQLETLRGNGETVMVVEDQVEVRESTRRMLHHHGFQVIAVEGPAEVLDRAAMGSDPPAVLLTDVVMPGISGPELVARVRAHWPGVAVVFMSGYPTGPGSAVPQDLPLVRKPFTPQDLLRAIHHAIAEAGR